jgi:hypothetical protein
VPSSTRHKVLFVTILPSPYQRDLFAAHSARGDVDLTVCYLDSGSHHNPWPPMPLGLYERVSMYVNWSFPALSPSHVVVLSTFTSSMTGQWMMRVWACRQRWFYWGEPAERRSGLSGSIQRALAAPLERESGCLVGIGNGPPKNLVCGSPPPHASAFPITAIYRNFWRSDGFIRAPKGSHFFFAAR